MPKLKATSFRFTDTELELFDDVADRLQITRTEAAQLGLHALRKQMGLLDEDAVAFEERIARSYGDDAVLRFTINGINDLNVDVTINGEPVPDMIANVLFAMTKIGREAQGFTLPAEATILAKDRITRTWFTIGRAPLEEGASVDVPLKRMADLVQHRVDDDRTPAERRHDARMNSLLRRAIREARGEPEDDE
jgi:hypothetical protein